VVDAFNCIRENIEMFVASDCFNLLSPESILALFMTSKLRPHLDVEHFNTHFHNSVMKWLFRENELENDVKQSILEKLDMDLMFAENLFDLMQMKILDSVEHILEENILEIDGLRNELEDLKAQLQTNHEKDDERFLIASKLNDIIKSITGGVAAAHNISLPELNLETLGQAFTLQTASSTFCLIKSWSSVFSPWNLLSTSRQLSVSVKDVTTNIYQLVNFVSCEISSKKMPVSRPVRNKGL